MKKTFFLIIGLLLLTSGLAYAPLVTTFEDTSESSSGSGSDDTSVVDLSDKDTDQPTWSPSFENTPPAGSAPGGPIED